MLCFTYIFFPGILLTLAPKFIHAMNQSYTFAGLCAYRQVAQACSYPLYAGYRSLSHQYQAIILRVSPVISCEEQAAAMSL